jgi:hypothetical protein
VVQCGDTADEIAAAIDYALSPEGRQRAALAANPYYKPNTVDLMVDAIMHFDFSRSQKKFYDIK